MENRTTCALHDIVDEIEFLAALQVKENAASYQQTDYLRLKNRCNVVILNPLCNDEQSFSYFEEQLDNNIKWEMSVAGRLQVGQWFYQMTCSFGFPIDFAVISMNYFDRMLSRSSSLSGSKSEIQLLALTCFYLTVKLFQTGPILSIDQISMISGFVYTSTEIVSMEKKVLSELDWCLYPPLASAFVRPYLKILLSQSRFHLDVHYDEITSLAFKMMNVVVMDYYFVANQFPPSHVAVAIIVNAILTVLPFTSELLTVQDITGVLSQLSGYSMKENDVFLCCRRLWELTNINHDAKFDNCTRPISYTLSSTQVDHGPKSQTPHSPVVVSSFAIHGENRAHFNQKMERPSFRTYNYRSPVTVSLFNEL